MRKGMIAGLVLLLLCTGCSTKTEGEQIPESRSEQDELVERNGLRQLDMKTLKEKIEKKEAFVVIVTQSSCVYCTYMKRSVVPYIREHADVPFYELEMDRLGTKVSDVDDNFTQLSKLIEGYNGSTPDLIYMKEGNIEKQQEGDMDETAFHNFLVDCGLVKEEKREVEKEDTVLQQSACLKEISMIECAKKLDDKEDFYLYIAEDDRYNALFSKKLADYAEKQNLIVYVLNMTTMDEPGSEEEYEKISKASEKIGEVFSNFLYTPSIFKVEAGIEKDTLIDNVTEEELKTWFEK